jgi:phosphohistidine phosphatase
MDLILWRHAEAEDGTPDVARKLTPKGHRQAKEMSRWLASRLPKTTRIVVSPAIRAQQTATALGDRFEIVAAVGPGTSTADVCAAAGWPDGKGAVLVVGHQPTLGLVASTLIAGEPMPWSIRKGAIWWLSHRARGEQGQVVLHAVMSPDLL